MTHHIHSRNNTQELSLLIVDDEEDFVTTMEKRLTRRGITCNTALTGAEAVERIRSRNFDAVLLDMKLPDMDGNTVLREIMSIRPDIRVLILTGHASVLAGEEGMTHGAADYLLKPVEFESLLQKIFPGHEKTARGSPQSCTLRSAGIDQVIRTTTNQFSNTSGGLRKK